MANLVSGVRRTVDIRTFLKTAQSNDNGIKYTSESGKKHRLYVPCVSVIVQDENGNQVNTITTVSEMHQVHEWAGKDGKFKSALCLSELGLPCPFCDRVGDAWEIYKYRYEAIKNNYIGQGMTDEQAEYEMQGDKDKKVGGKKGRKMELLDQLKMKKDKNYFYLLVAQFQLDGSGEVITEGGMPKYDLKVMKLSETRTEKLFKQLENAGGYLEGQELAIDYPKTDDVAERVGQSTTSVVYGNFGITAKFPGLKEKIDAEAAEFSWEGIEKSFPELTAYSKEGATELCDENFNLWDKYVAASKVDPNVKYGEYALTGNDRPAIAGPNVGAPVPQMGAPVPQMGAPIGAPVGQVPPMGAHVGAPVGQVPQMGAPVGAPMNQAPQMGAPVGTPVGAPVGAPQMGAPVGNLGAGAPIQLNP